MVSYYVHSLEGLLTGDIPVNNISCDYTVQTSGKWWVSSSLDPNNESVTITKENKATKTAGVAAGINTIHVGTGKITNDDYQLLMKTLSQGRSLSKSQFESTSDFIIWRIQFSKGFLTYCHFYRRNAHRCYVFASAKRYSISDLRACLELDGVGYDDVSRMPAGSPVQNTGAGDAIACCFFTESYTPFDRNIFRFGGVYTYSQTSDKTYLSYNDSSITMPFNEFLDRLDIGEPQIDEKDDEYGNYSGGGGYGGGSFDDSSDAFGLPTLPSLGVSEVGFVNVYNPTKNELLGFADELFPDYEKPTPSQKEGIEGVVENLANVTSVIEFLTDSYINKGLIDFVIDCHIVPVTPTTTSNTGLKVGFKTFEYDPKKVVRDYVEFDCGSLSIPEYYQNFLDYYGTRAKLYCPFIGFVDVKPEWFQSGVLQLIYHFNVIDGSCIAFLIGTSSKSNLKNTVVATFGGNCCVHMPITGLNYSSMITGIVAGGASIIGSGANKDLGGMARGVTEMLSAKPSLEQSNGYNAGMSYMCYRRPYLLIERPVASFSKNYPHEQGLPLNATQKLSNMRGFTTCKNANLDGINCTEEERGLLKEALEVGCIF